MANEIYNSTWWGNTIDTASSIGTSTEMIQGQFNMLTSNQPNLVFNGDFATDSVWVKDGNWSIADGKATSTANGRMFQSIPFLETNVGTKVVVSFDIVDYTSGGVVIQCYGASSENFTGVGTHTFTTTTTNTLNFYINNSGLGNLVGSITNISVKEVRATTVEASKCLADAIHRIGIQDIQN